MFIEVLMFCFIPFVICVITQLVFSKTITRKELALQAGLITFCMLVVSLFAVIGTTHDIYQINGQVTNKVRDHGSYMESYSCHCKTDKEGHRRCQTCHRKIYTVSWYVETSIGRINIDYSESRFSSVYSDNDPKRYSAIQLGEPVTGHKSFENLIKASKKSLFHKNVTDNYPIPQYPEVYDIYRFDRVLGTAERSIIDAANEMNKTLGPRKGANVIFILTKNQNRSYKHAVENAWLGGKINDIVILIGVEGNSITWADAFTYANSYGNEQLVIELRDALEKIGQFDFNKVLALTETTVSEYYRFQDLKNFDYLKDDMELSTAARISLSIFAFLLYIGTTIFMHKEDFFAENTLSYYQQINNWRK